ncbi:MAG: response regulator transcription factor [Anaerolineae bacterium]|nr:response regulator transcription factor [Anaerolineae bacterium]
MHDHTSVNGHNHPLRVLIADDQRVTRQGLVALLSLLPDVEIVGEARDGQEVIQKVRQHRPDVVVLDVQMPTMDGLTATRNLKRAWPEIRVVVLTMYAGYRQLVEQAGADAFLLKGATVAELSAAIWGK